MQLLCPSCNARRMAETAAHLGDHVFPPLPARMVVSLPLVCPNCGAEMRIIAFITEAAPIECILT